MKLLKKCIELWFFCMLFNISVLAQNSQDVRIEKIKGQLTGLQSDIPGLLKIVDFSISTTELTTFLKAVATSNEINISVDSTLKNLILSQSFSNATVQDVLLYLCKQHQLTIEVTGNILVIKKYKQRYVPRNIPIAYDEKSSLLTIDLQNDSLSRVLRKITDITGKNLVFSIDLEGRRLTGFIKNKPFDDAINILAKTNHLKVSKTQEGFYLFENKDAVADRNSRPQRPRMANFYFKVKDTVRQILEVDFIDTPIEAIINDIGYDLKINMATSKPLKNIGKTSVKSDSIAFDALLSQILKDTRFVFKKEHDIYLFGDRKQSSVQNETIIPLMHRSIQMMMQPLQSNGINNNYQSLGNNQNNNFGTRNTNTIGNTDNYTRSSSSRRPVRTGRQDPFTDFNSDAEALLSIFPKSIKDSLNIGIDIEHNSFVVSGDALRINRFKDFLKKIDKPVPVILIEVMIIEVNKSVSFSIGLDLGIGENPTADQGTILDGTSGTNLTLGATTINNIIGGFNGFGSANLGKVVPNFYARIQALETNGDITIKSTPKLSTLNGHEATLSNGVRSYYKITRTDIIGSQNPQTINTVDYIPTDANLSIKIRPVISGDGNITLSINVVQSNFNSDRIAADAPPGINSREFTSTIRVNNKDVIILGGLEENLDNKSGSGVPFLARIPIIKYLFSKRTRTKSKKKLSVLIKPTIIN
ncbi:MAG: general secretion pathway protein GspD [Flavobacteriaceae bacterium]|nr:MAG: general secretion pathway protein GspD [Flavobacteriaceae bacterium]